MSAVPRYTPATNAASKNVVNADVKYVPNDLSYSIVILGLPVSMFVSVLQLVKTQFYEEAKLKFLTEFIKFLGQGTLALEGAPDWVIKLKICFEKLLVRDFYKKVISKIIATGSLEFWQNIKNNNNINNNNNYNLNNPADNITSNPITGQGLQKLPKSQYSNSPRTKITLVFRKIPFSNLLGEIWDLIVCPPEKRMSFFCYLGRDYTKDGDQNTAVHAKGKGKGNFNKKGKGKGQNTQQCDNTAHSAANSSSTFPSKNNYNTTSTTPAYNDGTNSASPLSYVQAVTSGHNIDPVEYMNTLTAHFQAQTAQVALTAHLANPQNSTEISEIPPPPPEISEIPPPPPTQNDNNIHTEINTEMVENKANASKLENNETFHTPSTKEAFHTPHETNKKTNKKSISRVKKV